MAKRKFTKKGETPTKYQCCNRKCKWEGTLEEQKQVKSEDDDSYSNYVCPNCGKDEFYGLL